MPTHVSVQNGWILCSDEQLESHTLPDVGLTMYITGGSPTSSLSALGSNVGPPLCFSVVFGEWFISAKLHCLTYVIQATIFARLNSGMK